MPGVHLPESPSRETEICRQRLSAERALTLPQRPSINGLRPKSLAKNRGYVGLFPTLGYSGSSGRLPGGAEGIRTPDLCSAIAALSHLSYSPVARVFTCAPDPCQRRRRGASGLLCFNGRGLKGWENSCARSSTS